MVNILFMCVGNSARSQVAEGLAKEMFGPRAIVESAGSDPSGQIQPWAVNVMKERGIDISSHRSKSYNQLEPAFVASLDYVITLCAEEVCPRVVSKAKKLHWPLLDPAKLTEVEKPAAFRDTANELEKRLKSFGLEHGLI